VSQESLLLLLFRVLLLLLSGFLLPLRLVIPKHVQHLLQHLLVDGVYATEVASVLDIVVIHQQAVAQIHLHEAMVLAAQGSAVQLGVLQEQVEAVLQQVSQELVDPQSVMVQLLSRPTHTDRDRDRQTESSHVQTVNIVDSNI
jgi:uncharacterized protein (DUF1501 family)